MEELLKELGYTDEQIKAILEGMQNKKIFTTAEENADIRMSKLQEDFTTKDNELTKANELIEQLQKGTKGNEELQTKITTYETEIAEMKEQQHEKDVESALKFELLKNKAKADDIDYLIFKIKSDKDKKLEVDEKGNLKDFKMEDFKKEFKNNFEDEASALVDVKKLGGAQEQPGGNQEPNSLLDALKDKYASKDEM